MHVKNHVFYVTYIPSFLGLFLRPRLLLRSSLFLVSGCAGFELSGIKSRLASVVKYFAAIS